MKGNLNIVVSCRIKLCAGSILYLYWKAGKQGEQVRNITAIALELKRLTYLLVDQSTEN